MCKVGRTSGAAVWTRSLPRLGGDVSHLREHVVEVAALPIEPPAVAAPPELVLADVHPLGHVLFGGVLRDGLDWKVAHGTTRKRTFGGKVERSRDLHELRVRIIALH